MSKKIFSQIKEIFKNLDKKAIYILKKGLKFCFILTIVSAIILVFYKFNRESYIFEIGFTMFRASIIFAIEFVICAIAVDKIKKQLI